MSEHGKYRKKPVVIEAFRWEGPGDDESLKDWVEGFPYDGNQLTIVGLRSNGQLPFCLTMEGKMTVSPGDWIIRGVQGEFYPCKPDIFDATYEPSS